MSADQVTSTAGGASGTGLSSVTGTLQGGLSNILSMGTNLLNKIFPPEKREELKSTVTKFATEKPYLASFLLSQIAISGFPMFLFVVMTVTVTIFALVVGLLVGLIGAVLFILGAVGFALVFLLPTLFFTTFAAVGIWLWGMGAYYIIKKFNQKDVPGIHKPMGDGFKKSAGMDGVSSGFGQDTSGGKQHQQQQQLNGTAEKPKPNPAKQRAD